MVSEKRSWESYFRMNVFHRSFREYFKMTFCVFMNFFFFFCSILFVESVLKTKQMVRSFLHSRIVNCHFFLKGPKSIDLDTLQDFSSLSQVYVQWIILN